MGRPTDSLTNVCFDFAVLRAKIRQDLINRTAASREAIELDARLLRWSNDALLMDDSWTYCCEFVIDSPHIWNGVIHTYGNDLAWGAWMTFRMMRILVSRTQEMVSPLSQLPEKERRERACWDRTVRRQMTDDICAAVPARLCSAGSTEDPACPLIDAYSVIWPLFLAGACSVERLSVEAGDADSFAAYSARHTCAANAQSAWILARLKDVSARYGVDLGQSMATALGKADPLQGLQ